MAKAVFATDLARAVNSLRESRGMFSTQRKRLRDIVRALEETEAVLAAIEAYAPGYLRAIESSAMEEFQVMHASSPPEVTALIERYAGKVSER